MVSGREGGGAACCLHPQQTLTLTSACHPVRPTHSWQTVWKRCWQTLPGWQPWGARLPPKRGRGPSTATRQRWWDTCRRRWRRRRPERVPEPALLCKAELLAKVTDNGRVGETGSPKRSMVASRRRQCTACCDSLSSCCTGLQAEVCKVSHSALQLSCSSAHSSRAQPRMASPGLTARTRPAPLAPPGAAALHPACASEYEMFGLMCLTGCGRLRRRRRCVLAAH